MDSDLAHIFGDLNQSEKNCEIKLPLYDYTCTNIIFISCLISFIWFTVHCNALAICFVLCSKAWSREAKERSLKISSPLGSRFWVAFEFSEWEDSIYLLHRCTTYSHLIGIYSLHIYQSLKRRIYSYSKTSFYIIHLYLPGIL